MCKASDRYWEREIGKELICKCGKTHYKERRAKSNTCKECLAEGYLKKLLNDVDKTKKKVFRLIGVWQCTSCEVIKPEYKFHSNSTKKGACGKCNDCYNRHARNNHKWVIPKEDVEQTRLLNLSKKRTDVQLICCAGCGVYEVKKESFFRGCFCTSCLERAINRNRARDMYMQSYSNVRDCERCGSTFSRTLQSQRVCSTCKTNSNKKAKRIERQRYRARKRSANVIGVKYDPYAVFKRDKWTCYMCNTKTQKKDIYANDAAEIDHVVPLSKGGKDIPSNVKCCCRACNRGKSDKIIPVTGNLFCQA